MRKLKVTLEVIIAALLAMTVARGSAQNASPATKGPREASVVTGQILFAGRSTPYFIRHLPVSSFPALPGGVRDELERRSCSIPQTYEAHRPENVVRANLEGRGESDWAVLCAAQGSVSLLVFFDGSSQSPTELASAPETERLQAHDSSGVLGFNWGIDPASPRQVAEAQTGLIPRPPVLDHDAIADEIVDHKTIYHFYAKGAWTLVKLPD
jgi:hypothetical protein